MKCAQCGYQWQVGAAAAPAETRQAPPPPPPVVPPLPPLAELAYLQRPRPAGAAATPAADQAEPPFEPAPPPPDLNYPPPVPARLPARVPRTGDDGRGQGERDSFATLVEAARQTSNEAEARRAQRERRQANPWLISLLLLLLAVAIAWLERNHIMHIWPPSTRLFDAISRLFHK